MINKFINDNEYLQAYIYLTSQITPINFAVRFWQSAKLYYLADNKWEIYINNKKVVNNNKIIEVLKQMWLNPLYGEVGLNRFYNHIKAKFIGITKQSVHDFLNSLESYQLHKKLIKTTSINPIIPSQPYQYFQADLIDMSKYVRLNNGYNWILTIIDSFTKKAFTIPLKNKEGITVAKAIEKWLQQILPY